MIIGKKAKKESMTITKYFIRKKLAVFEQKRNIFIEELELPECYKKLNLKLHCMDENATIAQGF